MGTRKRHRITAAAGQRGPRIVVIYSGTRGDFGKDERDILARLTANIDFGLNALRTGEERDRQNRRSTI